MIKNYFKTLWRGLLKNKFYSAINILGLTIGMASALFILLWIQNEVSHDRFYEKTDYRTSITIWVFLASGIGALTITLLTVSFQSIKAAIANPVKSLRTE